MLEAKADSRATPMGGSSVQPGCTLEPPIGVARESAFASSMHRRVIRPRPAAKLRPPIIGESLLQFRAGVHHEWPILSDWFANRPPLEQENLDGSSMRFDGNLLIGADLNRGWTRHIAPRNAQPGSGELMKRPHRPIASRSG